MNYGLGLLISKINLLKMFNHRVQKTKPTVKDIKHPFPVTQFCNNWKVLQGQLVLDNLSHPHDLDF